MKAFLATCVFSVVVWATGCGGVIDPRSTEGDGNVSAETDEVLVFESCGATCASPTAGGTCPPGSGPVCCVSQNTCAELTLAACQQFCAQHGMGAPHYSCGAGSDPT